jgi:hypothetical protein
MVEPAPGAGALGSDAVSWRSTGILLLVAAALAGAIWWSNRHEAQTLEATEQAKRLFADLEPAQIDWIALETSDGREARLARREGAWRVVEPVDFPADATAADAIATALATLSSEALFEDPQPLSVYGLGEDAQSVRFGAVGQEYELRVGKKTPVGANRYAATGTAEGSPVFTVATFKTASFDKPLDDLRERRPLRFERSDVTRIDVEWSDGGVIVERRDGEWRLVAPIEGEADEKAIETLLSDLVFLRADGFVDEPPPAAEMGLEDPQYRVVLSGQAQEGEEPPRWELAIGSVIDTSVRAGKAAESALYEIPDDRFQKLPKRIDAFRFKRLAEFVASDAERFELVFRDLAKAEQGSTEIVTITGTRSESGWATTPEPMGAGLASRFVAEMAGLDATDIAADEVGPAELEGLGLLPAQTSIRIFGKPPEAGGDAPVLADVQLGVQQDDRVIAKRADRPTVFRMDAALAEHIPVSLEAYRNRFLSKESPEAEAAPPGGQADSGDNGLLEGTGPDERFDAGS